MRVTSRPLITIGFPVRNAEDHLNEAFDWLLGQTEGRFVLLISDNASTDATESICRKVTREDRRIRYVRQPRNLGATRNFEYLLRAATTPMFAWVAADDPRHPDFLKETSALLTLEPDALGAATGIQVVDTMSGSTTLATVPPLLADYDPVRRADAALKQWGSTVLYGLYRRESVLRILGGNLLPELTGSDQLFVFRLSLHGRFALTEQPLMVRRVSGYAERLGPDGRLHWEKRFGDDGALYDRYDFRRFRYMLAEAQRAPLTRAARARIVRRILREWQDMLVRSTRVRRRHALAQASYLRAAALLVKEVGISPGTAAQAGIKRAQPLLIPTRRRDS
jgi:glycosyltransferase involved in cell wall biosynthesis